MGGKSRATLDIKNRFSFNIGIRFELFYALQAVTDESSRVHTDWLKRARAALPEKFWDLFEEIGGSPVIWPLVADTLKLKPDPELSYQDISYLIQDQSLQRFQRKILEGAIHSQEIVDALLSKELSLQQVLGKVPSKKREWLSFIGLYPYDPVHRLTKTIENLLDPSTRFQEKAAQIIKIFWDSVFSKAWPQIEPLLKASLSEKERLFESCSLQEFATQSLIRVEISDDDQLIRAVRGGYQLPFADLSAAFVLPSVFNDKRYWTCYEGGNGTTAFFPYFDPSINVDSLSIKNNAKLSEPELDVALIFKALGDPTRFAIASLIAESARPAVTLAKLLSISKPTVSHHVHILREAGLLNENVSNGSVLLSLKQEVFEGLSRITLEKFFGKSSASKTKVKRSHV